MSEWTYIYTYCSANLLVRIYQSRYISAMSNMNWFALYGKTCIGNMPKKLWTQHNTIFLMEMKITISSWLKTGFYYGGFGFIEFLRNKHAWEQRGILCKLVTSSRSKYKCYTVILFPNGWKSNPSMEITCPSIWKKINKF